MKSPVAETEGEIAEEEKLDEAAPPAEAAAEASGNEG